MTLLSYIDRQTTTRPRLWLDLLQPLNRLYRPPTGYNRVQGGRPLLLWLYNRLCSTMVVLAKLGGPGAIAEVWHYGCLEPIFTIQSYFGPLDDALECYLGTNMRVYVIYKGSRGLYTAIQGPNMPKNQAFLPIKQAFLPLLLGPPVQVPLECEKMCENCPVCRAKKRDHHYSGPYQEVNGKTWIWYCQASPRTRAASAVVRRSR